MIRLLRVSRMPPTFSTASVKGRLRDYAGTTTGVPRIAADLRTAQVGRGRATKENWLRNVAELLRLSGHRRRLVSEKSESAGMKFLRSGQPPR